MKSVSDKYKVYSLTESGIEKYLNHHRNLDLKFYYRLIKTHKNELLKESAKIKRKLEAETSEAIIHKGVAQIAKNAALDAWLARLRAAVLAKLQSQIIKKKARRGKGRYAAKPGNLATNPSHMIR